MKSILVVGVRGLPEVEGGVEKHAERLFPLIADQGWAISIAGMKPFLQPGQYRGVRLWRAPALGVRRIDRWLYAAATLVKAFRMRPDIVHFARLESAALLLAYKLTGCKTVVRYGADCDAHPWTGPRKWAMRCAQYQLRWADSIVALTPALAKKLQASGKGRKIHIIGNALAGRRRLYPVCRPDITEEKCPRPDLGVPGLCQAASAGEAGDRRPVGQEGGAPADRGAER